MYRRDISDNESLYIYLQDIFTTFAMNMVLEGKGEINLLEVEKAVENASEACPSARLIKVKDQWIDSKETPPVFFLKEEEIDKNNLKNTPFLQRKIDPEKGPTSEVVVLQGYPTRIVFRVFHGTMDGKGALLWIENIFRALRGEKLVLVNEKETDLSFLKRHKNYSKKHTFPFDISTTKEKYTINSEKVWCKRLTLKEKPRCLVAKIAEVLTFYAASSHNLFLVPVDIRRHEKKYLSNANLTLPLFLKTTKGEKWSKIHQTLLSGLYRQQEMNLKSADLGLLSKIPSFLMKAGLYSLFKWQNRINKQVIGGIISDIGRIDIEALSTSTFQAETFYSLTVQQPFTPFTITIASNKNTTEIVISCYENEILIAHAEKVLEKIRQNTSFEYQKELFNKTEKNYPVDKTVVDLIEDHIRKNPQALAIECGGKKITYQMLGSQIDQIAAYLLGLGIKEKEAVGIYMHRNVLFMPVVLAILKIGAFYVPFSTELPENSLQKLLKGADLKLCITESGLKERFLTMKEQPVLFMEDLPFNPTELIKNASFSKDVAYRMYTSGSTGTPKGVEVEHQSLMNYLFWAKEAYQVTEKSVFPLFASLAFDSTLTAMFLPLISGGAIEIFEETFSHLTLKKIMESSFITHIKLSPAHLQLAIKIKLTPGIPKTLIVGGDALPVAVAEKVKKLYGKEWKIINEYGPTEATIGCITYTCNPAEILLGNSVPIGRPIMNTKVYLLDENFQEVAKGAVGEMYLLGDSLARGYFNDSLLTNKKFITLATGERAYKTGDLAQFNENGELIYLGRIDDQISLNGNRVELGEIEKALLEFKGITEAVVIFKKNKLNNPFLVAFYTSELPIDENNLKAYLDSSLPSYIRIHRFIRMETMPLTTNHKINKKELPFPSLDMEGLQKEIFATTPQEKMLIAIWKEVLQLEEEAFFSLTDNFYELGGDSLSMLILLNKITETMLPKELEQAFMSQIEAIPSPTLKNFSHLLSSFK